MDPSRRSAAAVLPRDGWVAVAYFTVYLVYLFFALESEMVHWVTLVAIPLAVAWISLPAGGRGLRDALASVGLQRRGFWRGVGWALLAGALITVFQVFNGGNAEAVRAHFRDGSALYLLPLSFAVMVLFAGFTEEFFFRGFLQTRLEALTGRRWVALLIASVLFAVYQQALVPHDPMNASSSRPAEYRTAAWGARLRQANER